MKGFIELFVTEVNWDRRAHPSSSPATSLEHDMASASNRHAGSTKSKYVTKQI